MTGSESFFDVLKSQRKSQNIEISEICEFTKISPKYIEAIESGDFNILPKVYMRLFLRAYANFIGSDPTKALNDYDFYTTGKITPTSEAKIKTADTPSASSMLSKEKTDSFPQISLQKMATGISVVFIILLLLWWASKITREQTENFQSLQPIVENTKNTILGFEEKTQKENLQSTPTPEIMSKENKLPVILPDKFPLNENDFIIEKKEYEILKKVPLVPPYTITLKTLRETKLHITKIENTNITELINKVVPPGQKFVFNFTSILNFEFWRSNQISVQLNSTSIDEYLISNDMAIRGSYEAKNSQLYLSFYKR